MVDVNSVLSGLDHINRSILPVVLKLVLKNFCDDGTSF